MTERRPLILRADTTTPRLQELPAGDLLPADTLGKALQVVLQGLVTSNNAGITSTDTVLQALGRLQAQASAKVDKDGAKVLSDNNFTNDERVKLANIGDGASNDRSKHTGTQTLASISNAGSAAAHNVQASPADSTAGAVLTVGAFGLGGTAVLLGAIDLNTEPLKSGLYYVQNAINGPGPSFNGWVLIADVTPGIYTFQTAFEVTGNQWIRGRNKGAWGEWRDIKDRANMTGAQTLSTISDAGNAAARTVMTSQTDVTAGRLMSVGAFGLGQVNSLTDPNLNNFGQFPSGVSHYYVNNASNGPIAIFHGYMTTEKVNDTFLTQTVKASGTGIAYTRSVIGGVATPWATAIDSQSAVGTIASGSIIERGSNSNGEYVKLADGTAITWGYKLGYAAGDNYVTLPISLSGGYCSSSLSIIPAQGWQTPLGWYAGNTSFVFNMPAANSGNGYTYLVIGRWK